MRLGERSSRSSTTGGLEMMRLSAARSACVGSLRALWYDAAGLRVVCVRRHAGPCVYTLSALSQASAP